MYSHPTLKCTPLSLYWTDMAHQVLEEYNRRQIRCYKTVELPNILTNGDDKNYSI